MIIILSLYYPREPVPSIQQNAETENPPEPSFQVPRMMLERLTMMWTAPWNRCMQYQAVCQKCGRNVFWENPE